MLNFLFAALISAQNPIEKGAIATYLTNGQMVVDNCSRKPTRKHPDLFFLMASSRCRGYIHAVIDLIVLDERKIPHFSRRFCNGLATIDDKYIEIVLSHYKRIPSDLNKPGAYGVREALIRGYQCRSIAK